MSKYTPLDYSMQIRFDALKAGTTPQEKAETLNLLEDILDESRSIDDVVNDFLNAKTPVVYKSVSP